ncbi:MAG: hypothetical protein DDG60_15005 [Anaerolineae bacterium]|nr:MAG: hypothetical protein DDG60_15005 [Anaerolineae bacterium]
MVEVHDPLSPRRSVVGILLTVLVVFLCLTLAGALLLGWTLLERGKCGTGDYTLRDELRVKTFALGMFGPPDWQETYSIQPYHVIRNWLSATYNAVVSVDYVLYNCGHTQTDLETYFSDESFRTQILVDYQDVERLAVCSQGETTLYIYSARLENADYLTYTWAKLDGKYRVLEVFMAFPTFRKEIMDQYARQLFPDLPSCP